LLLLAAFGVRGATDFFAALGEARFAAFFLLPAFLADFFVLAFFLVFFAAVFFLLAFFLLAFFFAAIGWFVLMMRFYLLAVCESGSRRSLMQRLFDGALTIGHREVDSRTSLAC
jgi:hypothetical protein